jgi:hypothetical protein
MWGAEYANGDVAMLRMPLSLFNDSTDRRVIVVLSPLPKPAGLFQIDL